MNITSESKFLNIGTISILKSNIQVIDRDDESVYVVASGKDTHEDLPVNRFELDYKTVTGDSTFESAEELKAWIKSNITTTPSNQAPVISNQTFSIPENSVNGTVVGTVAASDTNGDTLHYTIASGNSLGAFALNEDTGVLTVADATKLNYEAVTSFALVVNVSDGSLSTQATITVNVTDVYEPLVDPDLVLRLTGRVNNEMVASTGSNIKILTPVINMASNSGSYSPAADYRIPTNSFAIEAMVNITASSAGVPISLNYGNGSSTPGWSIRDTAFRIASTTSSIYSGVHNLELIGGGWIHIFVVVNRAGYLDIYKNGKASPVLHVDISAKVAESITDTANYLIIGGTNNFTGQLSYYRHYDFGGTSVPSGIAAMVATNYTTRKVASGLEAYLTHNLNPIQGKTLPRLLDFKGTTAGYGGVTNSTLSYSDSGSLYLLDYGYQLYRADGYADYILPLMMSGAANIDTNLIADIGGMYDMGIYNTDSAHPGLDQYKLRFTDAFFDRSNATIWGAGARSSSYYDASNTKDFHVSELNQRTIQSWLNPGYRGRFFVKMQSHNYLGNYNGSIERTDRVKLLEVLYYSSNKVSLEHKAILDYTGDSFAAIKDGSNAIVYDANNQVQLGTLQSTKPVLSLRLDDGIITEYSSWFPVLSSLGVTAYFCILTGEIGGTGFCTWEQIDELIAAGWEIGGHGVWNSEELRDMTNAQVDDRLATCFATLTAHGINFKNFVPHMYAQQSLYVRKVAMYSNRSTHAGYTIAPPEGANPKIIAIDNLVAMRGDGANYNLDTQVGIDAVKAQLDISLAENRWSILYWHGVSSAAITTIVNYAKSLNIDILNINEALDTCKYL